MEMILHLAAASLKSWVLIKLEFRSDESSVFTHAKNVKILHQSSNFLAVDKPPDMLINSNDEEVKVNNVCRYQSLWSAVMSVFVR